MTYVLATWMALLLAGGSPVGDQVTKEDVKKLARAGVGEEVILAFLRSNNARIDLSASDVVDLKEVGVTPKVIAYLLETKDLPKAQPRPSTTSNPTYRPSTTVYVDGYYPEAWYWPGWGYVPYGYVYRHYPYFGYYPYYRHYGYSYHGYPGHYYGGHGSGHSGHHGGGHGHR